MGKFMHGTTWKIFKSVGRKRGMTFSKEESANWFRAVLHGYRANRRHCKANALRNQPPFFNTHRQVSLFLRCTPSIYQNNSVRPRCC